MRVAKTLSVLATVAALSGCMPHKTIDDKDCGWSGVAFELTKQPLPSQEQAKAVAAMDMALAQMGYRQSQEVVGRFEAINPTPEIKYLHVSDWKTSERKGQTFVDTGEWGLKIEAYGDCHEGSQSKRDKYLSSIKDKLAAALQPYATEPVIISDTVTIFFD